MKQNSPSPKPAKVKGKKKGGAAPVMPSVSLADLEKWRDEGSLAWTYRTPPAAPRATGLAVSAAEQAAADGQFGYEQSPTSGSDSAKVRITFEDGRFIDITGPGLIGREPSAAKSMEHVHLITLDDPARELSRAHVAFGIQPNNAIWISDNYSTNGVELTSPGLGTRRCNPGTHYPLSPGDIVTFARHAMSVTQLVPLV